MNKALIASIEKHRLCERGLFLSMEVKDYGILYFDNEHKDSRNLNCAVLFDEQINDLKEVLKDVSVFYRSKGIKPTIYQTKDGFFELNKYEFLTCNYHFIESSPLNVYILNGKSIMTNQVNCTIERVTKYTPQIEDAYGKEESIIIQRLIDNPNYYVFLGKKGNEVVTMASIYYSDGIGHLCNIHTNPSYQGQGYARSMIDYLSRYQKKDSIIYATPTDELLTNIYQEAGFSFLYKRENRLAIADPFICGDDELSIRLMNDQDMSYLYKWFRDPEILKYWDGEDIHYTMESLIETYKVEPMDDTLFQSIILYHSSPIGYLRFYYIDYIRYDVDMEMLKRHTRDYDCPMAIDICIGEKHLHNNGLGTRVLRMLIETMFTDFGCNIVFMDPRISNPRAIRCYHKSGLHELFIAPKRELFNGVWYDNIIMSKRSY